MYKRPNVINKSKIFIVFSNFHSSFKRNFCDQPGVSLSTEVVLLKRALRYKKIHECRLTDVNYSYQDNDSL